MKETNPHIRALYLRQKMQTAMSGVRDKLGIHEFDARDFEVVPVTVEINGLDPEFNNYKIAHISDIHLGQWISAKRIEGVVNLVNKQNPDIVAITGDSVSYVVNEPILDMLRHLKNLKPNDVTLAVLGNHDHWIGANEIRKVMTETGIIELENDVYTVKRGGAQLNIAGIDSVTLDKHDLNAVLNKLPEDGPAILLAHEPDFADISAATGRFSLQLSGHSHGGQMIIPGMGTPFRGSEFRKYPLGRYDVGDMVQYTNRGLGTNVFWIRINCPPEITILNLQSSKKSKTTD